MKRERVLVTGASRGLGAALARACAQRGHDVFLAARSGVELEARCRELAADTGARVESRATDLRHAGQCDLLARAAEQAFGGIDVLINNAAIGPYRPFLEHAADDLQDIVAVNLTAPMRLAHALLPGMLARERGYVINIASDLARRPLAGMTPYVATKYALLGFGASLHKEVRSRGVRVTTVLPGIIDSTFNGSVEGTREARWALPTRDLAERIVELIALPPHVSIDELTVHPADGDY